MGLILYPLTQTTNQASNLPVYEFVTTRYTH